jgi:hypothetical protein
VILAALGHAYAQSGDRQTAQELLLELSRRSSEQYVPSFCEAVIWAGLSRKEEMFRCLTKAYEERCSWLFALRVEPLFYAYRSEPSFIELLHRVGLPRVQTSFGAGKTPTHIPILKQAKAEYARLQ